MTNPNDPAFSRAPAFSPDCGTMDGAEGLSKREEFAKAAMQGFLSSPIHHPGSGSLDDFISKMSVIMADALIAELNKEVK